MPQICWTNRLKFAAFFVKDLLPLFLINFYFLALSLLLFFWLSCLRLKLKKPHWEWMWYFLWFPCFFLFYFLLVVKNKFLTIFSAIRLFLWHSRWKRCFHFVYEWCLFFRSKFRFLLSLSNYSKTYFFPAKKIKQTQKNTKTSCLTASKQIKPLWWISLKRP